MITNLQLKNLNLLKNKLELLYRNFDMSKLSATYYRNRDDKYANYFSNTKKFNKLNIYFFIFLVLYSHNTRDEQTYKIFLTLKDKLDLNFKVTNFKEFFYKHKDSYYEALIKSTDLILKGLNTNTPILIEDLIKISYIGYKSAAIILNHFFENDAYPVVDINILKAYNQLFFTNITADKLYFLLKEYSDTIDSCKNLGFELANLLWMHRKFCKLNRCGTKQLNICSNCLFLRSELNRLN